MTRLWRLVAPALTESADEARAGGASRRARRAEDGFTIIELMVASGVMLVAITAMMFTTFAGMRGIALARQRQTANGLANQAMEQIRALPFDTVERGLGNTDLATSDSRITTTVSGGSTVYTFGGEQIPHGDNPNATPLVPHQQTITRNNVVYTLSTYVTYMGNNTTSNTYRATAIVSWTAGGNAGGKVQVQVQSVLYSPAGCGSTATHPFSAPCQAFLYGSASNASGSVAITGTIQSLTLDQATLWLPGQNSGTQVEQVQQVQGSAQASGLSLKLTGQTEQTAGRATASSGSDDDRSQSKPDYQTSSTGTQASATLTQSSNNNSITVSQGAGDTAASTSTVTANSSSKFCPLLVPVSSFDVSQNDALPCGSSKAQQGGTLSAAMNVRAGPTDLTTTLFSVAAPSGPSGAFTNRATTPQGSVCPTTQKEGCIQSLQYRQRGTVSLIKLPAALPLGDFPIGYDSTKGLIQLSGYSDAVSAEAGVGSAAPSVSVTGTIAYFNGLGYSTISLAPGASQSISLGTGGAGVHIFDLDLNGAPLSVDVTSNLSTGGTSTTDAGTTTCTSGVCRSYASAAANSPIRGTITYQVSYANTVVANLTITVDLGNVLAKSSYTAAPNGS